MDVGERIRIHAIERHVVVAVVRRRDIDIILAIRLQRYAETSCGSIAQRLVKGIGRDSVVQPNIRLDSTTGVLVRHNACQHTISAAAHACRKHNLAIDVDGVKFPLVALLLLHLRHLQDGVFQILQIRAVQRTSLQRVHTDRKSPGAVAQVTRVEQGVVLALLFELFAGEKDGLVVRQHQGRNILIG